jgi:hypothetical protein
LRQFETIFWTIKQYKVRSDVSDKRPAFLQGDNMVQIYEVTGRLEIRALSTALAKFLTTFTHKRTLPRPNYFTLYLNIIKSP